MRNYLPFLAISLVAIGCGNRVQTVTATTGNIHSWPYMYGNGSKVYRMVGDLPNYTALRINASGEFEDGSFTLPPYSSIHAVSENGGRMLVRRLDDPIEYAEVVDASNGAVLFSMRLTPWDEGQEPIEMPRLSPDGQHILYQVQDENGAWVTNYLKVVGGAVKSVPGHATAVAPGVGVFYIPETKRHQLFSLDEGTLFGQPFNIGLGYSIYQGRDGWLMAYNGTTFRFMHMESGTIRTPGVAAGDSFVGLGRNGKAIYYRKSRNMVTSRDLATNVDSNLFPYQAYNGTVTPSISPDGSAVTAWVSNGEYKIHPLDNPIDGAYSAYRRTAIQAGFEAEGASFTLHDDGKMTFRADYVTSTITKSFTVPEGEKYEGLATDGSVSFYRQGGYLYRHTPASGQATKWFAPWSVAQLLFSRDGKTAVEHYQNPRVGTQLRYRDAKGTPVPFTLPANTQPLAVMPDARVMWHDVPEGKTTLRFTEPATGTMRRSFYLGMVGGVKDVSVSLDGTKFVAWANDARFGDLTNNRIRKLDDEAVRGVAISPDGSLAAVAHLDRILVYKTSNYALHYTLSVKSDPYLPTKLAFSPDNSRIIAVVKGDMIQEKMVYEPL